MAQTQTAGFRLTGKISDIQLLKKKDGSPVKTKEGGDMFTYFVFTGRQVERVKSTQNGAKIGDTFNSWVNLHPYVSKAGIPGLEIWEGERLS